MKNIHKKWVGIMFLPLILLVNSCNREFFTEQQEIVTIETLLDEMVDRENIARLPAIPFTLKQFSSYHRESKSPDEPGWFANSDRTWFIRKETNQGRTEHVMVDTEGPGAIVRIWMTFAGEGRGTGIIRFYFDGKPEPVIEGTAFEILSGGALVGEPLAASVSDLSPYEERGHNLYLPLPYAKSCKITYESENITTPGNIENTGESVYYNINYRTYPEDTEVATFTMDELEKASQKVNLVQQQLLNRDKGLDNIEITSKEISADLKPGQTWDAQFSGSQAIRYIKMKVEADDLSQALRTTIIEAEFDGEKTIWCPVGDFFGTGYLIRDINTWYARVAEDGSMEVYWIMPFEDDGKLTISNIGKQDVRLRGEVGVSDWDWDDRSMHFGSSWHQFTNIFTREGFGPGEPGSAYDVNYVELTGEGILIGDGLTLFNTSYIWWGEGDEKIYVDGEAFPSHFGTGTEDYYGYAWGGRSERFSNHPLIAQPDESGNWKPGYVVNIRHRILDKLPFKESLKLDMEMWHWHPTWMNYAPATFYYMRPGGKTNIDPDGEGALAKVAIHSTDIIPNVMTSESMEAEHMAFYNTTGNKRGSMAINQFGDVELSGNLYVQWKDGNPGDSITLSFESEKAGDYNLIGDFTTGPQFGNFRGYLNNLEIHSGFSLNSPKPGGRSIPLGRVSLEKGKNTLLFIVQPREGKRHLFGLDKITIN